MVAFGFDELKLHRIWATCLPANPASMRVLKTPGMRQEGVQKSSLKVHGVWKDCFLYAVLEEAWRREAT
jgi:[ribosomal protein S5]-alanine N-acetyltransferase